MQSSKFVETQHTLKHGGGSLVILVTGPRQHADFGPVYVTRFKNWNSSAAFRSLAHATTALRFSDAETFHLWRQRGSYSKPLALFLRHPQFT